MKSKLVKIAALLCALTMILGVFAGCGNQNSSKAPESSAANTPESSTAPVSSETAGLQSRMKLRRTTTVFSRRSSTAL